MAETKPVIQWSEDDVIEDGDELTGTLLQSRASLDLLIAEAFSLCKSGRYGAYVRGYCADVCAAVETWRVTVEQQQAAIRKYVAQSNQFYVALFDKRTELKRKYPTVHGHTVVSAFDTPQLTTSHIALSNVNRALCEPSIRREGVTSSLVPVVETGPRLPVAFATLTKQFIHECNHAKMYAPTNDAALQRVRECITVVETTLADDEEESVVLVCRQLVSQLQRCNALILLQTDNMKHLALLTISYEGELRAIDEELRRAERKRNATTTPPSFFIGNIF